MDTIDNVGFKAGASGQGGGDAPSSVKVKAEAEAEILGKVKALASYQQQFGEYPVKNMDLEGNVKMFDSFQATLGASAKETKDGWSFGKKLGLSYDNGTLSVDATYEQRPGREPSYGLKAGIKF